MLQKTAETWESQTAGRTSRGGCPRGPGRPDTPASRSISSCLLGTTGVRKIMSQCENQAIPCQRGHLGIFLKLEIKLRPRSCFDRSSGLNTAFEPCVWVGSDYGGGLPWVSRPFDGPDTYPRNPKPKAGAGRTPRNAAIGGKVSGGTCEGSTNPPN